MGLSVFENPLLSRPTLLADHHDLASFISGVPVLDDWLRKRARSNQVHGASRTYVLCEDVNVIGYYSLASGGIALIYAPGRVRRNMPDPIPMTILARLALHQVWQNKGLGTLLLRDAILRTMQAADIIGVRGLLVHAISPAAKRFYEKHGFQESPTDPMMLLLPLKDAAALL